MEFALDATAGSARSLPHRQLEEIKGRSFNHQSAIAELADKENVGFELQQVEASRASVICRCSKRYNW